MHADLVLYTNPKRPLIMPQFDLFAFLDTHQEPALFPAKVVDRVHLMLPEKCREMQTFPNDLWEFLTWQVEEAGYCIVRTIDTDWLYWSILADKFTLLNMIRVL